jgi:hypothetical protein
MGGLYTSLLRECNDPTPDSKRRAQAFISMKYRTKLFLLLWAAGMSGVLSFLLLDLSALIAALPAAAGTTMPFPMIVVKLLSLIQPTILLSLAVLAGVALTPKVGLSSPAAEAAVRGQRWLPLLKPQIIPGIAGGLVGGVAIILSWLLWKPFLPLEFVMRAEALNRLMPFPMRLLYGGITEELLLRWGVMTLLVWIIWRLLQKGQGSPRALCYVTAIVVSALIFGVGHLPIAAAMRVAFTVPIVSLIVVANSVFGLIAGFLYWRKGLEAAIIAHMFTHVILMTGIYLTM